MARAKRFSESILLQILDDCGQEDTGNSSGCETSVEGTLSVHALEDNWSDGGQMSMAEGDTVLHVHQSEAGKDNESQAEAENSVGENVILDLEEHQQIPVVASTHFPLNVFGLSGSQEVLQNERKDPSYSVLSESDDSDVENRSPRSTPNCNNENPESNNEYQAQRGRKRQRTPQTWASNERKRMSTAGKAYVNVLGKNIPAKKVGIACSCKMDCFRNLGQDEINRIFTEFYKIESKSLQDAHLHVFGLIEAQSVQRRRGRTGSREGYRNCSYKYSVRLKDGSRMLICAKAFQSVHGIGKSRFERLRKPNATTSPDDKRGKHGNQKTISESTRKKVRDHINSFPKRQSHYSREQNPNRYYIQENLNVHRMWLLYLAKNEPNELHKMQNKRAACPTVKLHFYRHIFSHKFNIGFGLPRSDTCSQCDRLFIEINAAENDDSQKKTLEAQKEIHLRKAERGYELLKKYTEEAISGEDLDVYTFDFQQNLPLPTLSSSDMFYSRMLWVYNFGVHNCKTGQGTMHICDETQARRGSSEICTCLNSTIINDHSGANRLVIFSDSCAGQNKNKTMVCFLLCLIKKKVYNRIDHMFLIRGHRFLPNDRDFASIELYKLKCRAYLPDDYRDIIEKSWVTQPFVVKMMQNGQFQDHKKKADKVIKPLLKDVDDPNSNVKFRDFMWFSYGKSEEMNFKTGMKQLVDHEQEVWCKYSLGDLEPWKKLQPCKRNAALESEPEWYSKPFPLKAAKYLVKLGNKKLITSSTAEYYRNLPHMADLSAEVQLLQDSDADDYVN